MSHPCKTYRRRTSYGALASSNRRALVVLALAQTLALCGAVTQEAVAQAAAQAHAQAATQSQLEALFDADTTDQDAAAVASLAVIVAAAVDGDGTAHLTMAVQDASEVVETEHPAGRAGALNATQTGLAQRAAVAADGELALKIGEVEAEPVALESPEPFAERAAASDSEQLAARAAALDLRAAELDARERELVRERALAEAKEHPAQASPARMDGISGDVSRSLDALVALPSEVAQELGSLAKVRAIPSESVSDRDLHVKQTVRRGAEGGTPRRHARRQHAPAQRGTGSAGSSDAAAPAPAHHHRGEGALSLVRAERGRKAPADMDTTKLAQLVAALLMPIVFLVVGINVWVYYDQASPSSEKSLAEEHLSEQAATLERLRKA